MKQQAITTLKLLESLERDPKLTQRDLAEELNISLGLVNLFIRRLVQKGCFKIKTIPRNRIKYILTPKGFLEKSKLTYQYISHSLVSYKETRLMLKSLYDQLALQGKKRLIIIGADECAELAFLSLQESNLELAGILDKENAGNSIFGTIIGDYSLLKNVSNNDVVLVIRSDLGTDFHQIMRTYVAADNVIDVSR